jgi:FHA domain
MFEPTIAGIVSAHYIRQTVTPASTQTDAFARSWFHDDVTQLREWNTNIVHVIPDVPMQDCILGSASTCAIRLSDDSGQVSRLHARLFYSQGLWRLADLGSKNGILVEGSRCAEAALRPGLEVRLGGATLIAESPLLVDLREYLCRLLGWSLAAQDAVNLALRALRVASAGNGPLMLCGSGDLTNLARGLHDRVPRRHGPFVLCDSERQRAPASVRLAANEPTAQAAIAAAAGGSVCVRSAHLPPDFEILTRALSTPPCNVQMIICASGIEEARAFMATAIIVPPLQQRGLELGRIIDLYAADALAAMSYASPFAREDHAWILKHSAESIPDIEKGTMRLVAYRAAGTIAGAARLLGMAAPSLLRWFHARAQPISANLLLGFRAIS